MQQYLDHWEIGVSFAIGKGWNAGDQWSASRSIPFLITAQSLLPAATEPIPGSNPTGTFGDFTMILRKPVSLHWHLQPQIGFGITSLATAKDPGGQVSLEWVSDYVDLGLLVGWNTLPGTFRFSVRGGPSLVIPIHDSLYFDIGGQRKAVFKGLTPSGAGPRLQAEAAMRYRAFELGVHVVDDFRDINGTPDKKTIQLIGVGLQLTFVYN